MPTDPTARPPASAEAGSSDSFPRPLSCEPEAAAAHGTALDHAMSALASIERVAARLVARGEPAEEVAGTILRADAAVLRSVIRELGRCAPREPR